MTIYNGTNGDNRINGSQGNDVIYGNGGEDDLSGKKGNDLIYGGTGDDEVHGDQGNDTLFGQADDDFLFGNDGNDTLNGGAGFDFLDGGFGFDTAVYSGSIFEYEIYGPLFGILAIAHQGGFGADGADLVVNVERLVFADAVIDLYANNAPIAVNDSASTHEDVGTYNSVVSVLANDFDFEGNTLSVSPAVLNGTYGTLVLNADGSYSYTPHASTQALAQGEAVQDVFSYTVSDGSLTDTGALTITIAGANDVPAANADLAATAENDPLLIDVLANDTDVDNGAVLTVVAASAPPGQGAASIVGNQVRFDPGSDFDDLAVGESEAVVVSYTIEDEHGASSSSTVTITVTGTNDGPVANPDLAATSENAAILVDVLANDTDVDNGAVLTVTAASAPAGQGSASIIGNQVRFDPGSDFDDLAVGESEAVVVSYTIADEHGASSSSTVTITVTGTNDGPVANPDLAATSENAATLVDVLANDTDADNGAVLTVTAASAPAGQGSASIIGNQVRFDPGSDFDDLAAGESEVVVVSYTIADEHGASSSSTVTITVTGTNDGPVANPDVAATSENAPLAIDVLANDTDADNGAVLTVTAASAPAGQGSASVVANQVQFDPGSDFDYLAVGESVDVVLSYTIEDEHGATASSSVTVTVTGTNDAPTIDAGGTDASGAVTELPNGDPNENDFTHQDSGTVAFDDVDLSDTHGASFTPQGGGYVGSFTLDPVDQAGDSVGWSFSVDDSVIDSLDEGEVLTQTYTVEIDDGNGGTVTQDVTVTITGAGDNVPPDAVDDAYEAIGNVVLDVPAGAGVLANDQEFAGGSIGTGPGQTSVSGYDAVSANGGTVTMTPDGSFSYVSAPGFEGTDSFTYTITDPDGASDTATVTLTVGEPVWFIDNSAVGSLNLGTQDHPFTSIAAFNAAQGTPDGPAAGETVYLREGTGTYAEPDGINLLDGQSLIGGGQDLVVGGDLVEAGTGRPTIVTTGAGNHGVELAEDNSLAGFDIGSTAGAGIADGNGTVGTLSVTDVGKTGDGQVVDIDQGGTLDVTLSGAESTGSTGGAIDLAGVSGSFTVAGATNITGTHSGGGVDVTGSSASITFAGGGLVSTGSATAVNFSGNSGSLAISGGNFDIATTSGRALNVENGGSVAIGGTGNNIASTTGSAVVIRNASSNGVTVESVSSAGGSEAGIILENTGSGGFSVTGTASDAGSGGTITDKNGGDGSLTQGSGIVILGTANVSLANMVITDTDNHGILGNDVLGFTLRDSNVSGTHGDNLALDESSVSFTNLGGTALLEGNVISGGRGDNVRIINDTGSLDLTIRDSAEDEALFGSNHLGGNDGLHIETGGTASLELDISGVDFEGARSELVQILAYGNSTQNIEIHDSNFHNAHGDVVAGGGGIHLGGGGFGSNVDVDYLIEGSSFRGAQGNALSAAYNLQSGSIQGRIEGNIIGVNDGVGGTEGSSGGGSGIFLDLEKVGATGSATYAVAVVGNGIYDVDGGAAALFMTVSGGNSPGSAVFEATVTDNEIAELGDFTFTGIYAGVGLSSGDYSQFGLDLSDNVVDVSGADFGIDAVFLDQISANAHFYFPDYPGSGEGEFNGGTASEDLGAFFAGQGNLLVNGGFPSWPNGVDASLITGATGDPLVLPPWFP